MQRDIWHWSSGDSSGSSQGGQGGQGGGDSGHEHGQYVRIAEANTITAQHSFAPLVAQQPFLLGVNARYLTIPGLQADTLARSVIAGNGLTNGGELTSDITLHVGASGLGLTVGANAVVLTSSDNPGAAASILASDASGYLSLVRLKTDTLADKSGANLTIAPAGDVTFNPGGKDLLPYTNYDLNIGSINKKYLTLHAAELWVETLVAQEVKATINGRVVVGPSTNLTSDLSATQTNLLANPGFETAGGGGADVFADWDEYWADGNISQEAGTYHGGAYSCKIIAGASAYTIVQKYITVTPYYGYSFSFWTRGDGTYAGRYAIYDQTHSAWVISPTSTGVTGTTWTQVRFTALAPAGCANLGLLLMCPSVNGGYGFFDDVTWYIDLIEVKHNQMAVGDIVYLEANGYIEFMKVLVGPWGSPNSNYIVERNLDGTGTNAWYAGSGITNTGGVGDGYIDLYSIRSIRSATQYGPTIAGNIRTGTTYSDLIEAWAIGNLNGLYGYGADIYGVGLGQYSNSKSFVTIDPINGIRMRAKNGSGDETTKIALQPDGDVFIGSDISAAATTGLAIFSNAQTYNSETTIDAGDILIGDNTTSKANIYWDKADGRLNFRSGINAKSYIDIDGGFVVKTGAAYSRVNSVTFNNAADDVCDLSGYSGSGAHGIGLRALPITAHQSNIELLSEAPSTSIGYIYMRAFNASHESRLTLDGGASAGSIAMTTDSLTLWGDADTCNFQYDGNLRAYRNSQYYTGYIPVPLTTPLTSTSWDGDVRSTTAKTLIDLNAVFGVPDGIKMVLVEVCLNDSANSGGDYWFLLSPNNTAGIGINTRLSKIPDSAYHNESHWIPCDSNGNIYYQINASGTGTMEVYLTIWGYAI